MFRPAPPHPPSPEDAGAGAAGQQTERDGTSEALVGGGRQHSCRRVPPVIRTTKRQKKKKRERETKHHPHARFSRLVVRRQLGRNATPWETSLHLELQTVDSLGFSKKKKTRGLVIFMLLPAGTAVTIRTWGCGSPLAKTLMAFNAGRETNGVTWVEY
jgi:hypothetical protein